jgi:predicted RNase H-like HicB family nuclease
VLANVASLVSGGLEDSADLLLNDQNRHRRWRPILCLGNISRRGEHFCSLPSTDGADRNDPKGPSMKTYTLTAVIWQEKEGYVSKCPETGVASCGDSPEEALPNLREAVELYLENAKRLGLIRDLEGSLTARGKFTASFEAAVA